MANRNLRNRGQIGISTGADEDDDDDLAMPGMDGYDSDEDKNRPYDRFADRAMSIIDNMNQQDNLRKTAVQPGTVAYTLNERLEEY